MNSLEQFLNILAEFHCRLSVRRSQCEMLECFVAFVPGGGFEANLFWGQNQIVGKSPLLRSLCCEFFPCDACGAKLEPQALCIPKPSIAWWPQKGCNTRSKSIIRSYWVVSQRPIVHAHNIIFEWKSERETRRLLQAAVGRYPNDERGCWCNLATRVVCPNG